MQSIDKKLHDALKECIDEDLKFVPSKEEIKKSYTPSSKHKKYMEKIKKIQMRKDKIKRIGQYNKKIYYVATAAMIAMLILPMSIYHLFQEEKGNESAVPQFDMTLESSEISSSQSSEQDSSADMAGAKQKMLEDVSWQLLATQGTTASFLITNNLGEEQQYSLITLVEKLEEQENRTVYSSEELSEYPLAAFEEKEETIELKQYNMEEKGVYCLYRSINGNKITIEVEIK